MVRFNEATKYDLLLEQKSPPSFTKIPWKPRIIIRTVKMVSFTSSADMEKKTLHFECFWQMTYVTRTTPSCSILLWEGRVLADQLFLEFLSYFSLSKLAITMHIPFELVPYLNGLLMAILYGESVRWRRWSGPFINPRNIAQGLVLPESWAFRLNEFHLPGTEQERVQFCSGYAYELISFLDVAVLARNFFGLRNKSSKYLLKKTIWTTGRLDEASDHNSPCQKGMSPQTNVAHYAYTVHIPNISLS